MFKSALFHKKYMHFCPKSPAVSQNWLVLSGIKHINNIILLWGNFHESICLLPILKSTENNKIFVLIGHFIPLLPQGCHLMNFTLANWLILYMELVKRSRGLWDKVFEI